MPEPISTGGSAAAIKVYVLASVTIASIVLVCLVVLLMGTNGNKTFNRIAGKSNPTMVGNPAVG